MLSIILAGLLSLPALLVLAVTLPLVAVLSIPALSLLIFRKPRTSAPRHTIEESRVVVTGGSSGIGLSIARDCVERGVSQVTIIARNVKKLEAAKKSLQQLNEKVQVNALSVDVTDPVALSRAALKVFGKEKKERATYLFCCAGEPHPAYFQDIPSSSFEKLAKTNQLGSIYTAQAFLPHMTTGTIVFCSSICGQIGIFGYSAYAPTKFALRGFAECLHIELCNRPINVQVAYPPDTDTPGFEEENKNKPEETKLISEQAGLSKPEDIAHIMVREAIQPNPKFNVYFTFDGWMLAALTAGFSPVTTLGDAVTQVAGMCLFRFISLFYLQSWWGLIRKYKKGKDSTTKNDGVAKDNSDLLVQETTVSDSPSES